MHEGHTDIPNLVIMSQYLHGYTNHLSMMQGATAKETK